MRVKSDEGITLRTKRLEFISSSNEIKTDEDVEIAASGMLVTGPVLRWR